MVCLLSGTKFTTFPNLTCATSSYRPFPRNGRTTNDYFQKLSFFWKWHQDMSIVTGFFADVPKTPPTQVNEQKHAQPIYPWVSCGSPFVILLKKEQDLNQVCCIGRQASLPQNRSQPNVYYRPADGHLAISRILQDIHKEIRDATYVSSRHPTKGHSLTKLT